MAYRNKRYRTKSEKSDDSISSFSIIKRIVIIILVIIVFRMIIMAGFNFGHSLFYSEAMSLPPGKDIVVTVDKGESTSDVIKELKRAGLIKSEIAFRCQVIFYKKIIQPGEYTMNTSMKTKEILKYLSSGPQSKK